MVCRQLFQLKASIDHETENQLNTHDLEIPFGATTDLRTGNAATSRRLRVLLIAPLDVADNRLEQTMARISHFASLTGGEDVAIMFLVYPSSTAGFVSAKDLTNGDADAATYSNGMAAYSKLQIELLNHADVSPLSMLLLSSLDGLPALVKRHIANISRPRTPRQATTTTFELLKLCSATPPMPETTAFMLSDLFADLRDLAETCTAVTSAPNSSSPSARIVVPEAASEYGSIPTTSSQLDVSTATEKLKRLRLLLGEQGCMDVVDFWKEEWMMD